MGIPTCRFTDRQHEQFVCSICLDVAQDPVATNNCDHIFCRGCMCSHNSPTCATCQQKLLQPKFMPLKGSIKRIYMDLKVKCLNTMCTQQLDVGSYANHDQNCPISFIPCNECGFKIRRGTNQPNHSCIRSLKDEVARLEKKLHASEARIEARIRKLEMLGNPGKQGSDKPGKQGPGKPKE